MNRRADKARIAVVTVAFDSDAALKELLDSLPAAYGGDLAVTIVDNAPQLGSARAIAEHYGAMYLAEPGNPGYGGAVDVAVAQMPDSVQAVLVSNPDVRLGRAAIDRLAETLFSDPSIASVGPLLRNPDGTVYPSARAIPALGTGIGHALFANLWPRNPWSAAYRGSTALERRDAGWLSGACLLVRRQAFELIGGFDRGYFMYFEDVDLGWRLSSAGYRNVYEPTAEAHHDGAHSTASRAPEMLAAHHRSASRFVDRRYAGILRLPIRVVLRTGLALRAALAIAMTRRARPSR